MLFVSYDLSYFVELLINGAPGSQTICCIRENPNLSLPAERFLEM